MQPRTHLFAGLCTRDFNLPQHQRQHDEARCDEGEGGGRDPRFRLFLCENVASGGPDAGVLPLGKGAAPVLAAAVVQS